MRHVALFCSFMFIKFSLNVLNAYLCGKYMPMNEFDVFLSYSSRDTAVAEDVRTALMDAGVKCWMAAHDVHPGHSYPTEIMNALENASMMVLIYTAGSNASEHVANEVEKMFSDGKPIIVFMVEKESMCKELDYFLKRKHWLVAYPDYKLKLSELADAVLEVTGRRRIVPPAKNVPVEGICLKIVPDADCRVLVDFQEVGVANGGKMFKHILPAGEYNVQLIGTDDDSLKASYDVELEKDKLLRAELKRDRVVAEDKAKENILPKVAVPEKTMEQVREAAPVSQPDKKPKEVAPKAVTEKKPDVKPVSQTKDKVQPATLKKEDNPIQGKANPLPIGKILMIALPLLLLVVLLVLLLPGDDEKASQLTGAVETAQNETVTGTVAEQESDTIIISSIDTIKLKINGRVVDTIAVNTHEKNLAGTHEYVDLGLSVKWGACNVGAASSTDYGNYYAWGEIDTKDDYSKKTLKDSGLALYSISGDATHDAARAEWGAGWRIPTKDEFEELIEKCKWEWTTQDGKRGYKVIGKNGNSIFLPASGGYDGNLCDEKGVCGYYWCATASESYQGSSYFLYFNSSEIITNWFNSYYGYNVRPVLD